MSAAAQGTFTTLATLYREHGRWPTVEEFAAFYDVPVSVELRATHEATRVAFEQLESRLLRETGDDPWVCDLCGQLIPEGGRCNSGIHEGPDIPANLYRGFAVRLSRSRFKFVTPTPPG